MQELIKTRIHDSIDVKTALLDNEEFLNTVENLANEIVNAIQNGNKLVLCGNGGSASDSIHIAAELS